MSERKKVTLFDLMEMKRKGQKITYITAYTYPQALLADAAGMDMVLVGDSMYMTELGYPTTMEADMDVMVVHARAVSRACKRSFVIGDMPYMTFQPSVETAIRNAGRYMSEGGCDGVKLEGGAEMADRVEAIVKAGIPVMGHLGMTPMRMAMLGGFKVQAREASAAKRLVDDARALEEAGAFSILLECVPRRVAKLVTERASIPILSIGAGPDCDGQLLIFHDLFHLCPIVSPKFVKEYANVWEIILDGLKRYAEDVREVRFPEDKHCYHISDDEYKALLGMLE